MKIYGTRAFLELCGTLVSLNCLSSLQDGDHNLSLKKAVPLPLFSAADILQVVRAYGVPVGLRVRDGQSGGVCLEKVPVSLFDFL